MKYQIIVLSIIFSISIITPTAHAQINPDPLQRSIQVDIDSLGNVIVTHEIKKQNSAQQLDLLDGTVTNLTVTNEDEEDIQFGTINENSIMILPSNEEVIVSYELKDVLTLEDNIWTWNVLYLHSTSFILPEEADLIFVNEQPVLLGDKPGIMCHGCQMKLEYSLDQKKSIQSIKNQNEEYIIEIITWAEINQFRFDKDVGMTFEIEGDNDFVTVIIPKNFLNKPYEVLFDDEKIRFHSYIENGTHTWLNLRPESSGQVSISGVIVPDFTQIDTNSVPVEYVIGIGIAIAVGVGIIFIKKRK
ncbi:MAG: hypothetical protein GTN35_05860 [Nitrososphaeria archaeon]|nr:hypothetical protein [Nitrosopumilaceae archaeon]NIP10418.1 hypothetical protein [Nitrosopumilaceae archaeon]NIP91895.1 hypothetical protein [Nitrososphaeria archaeon]NIS95964.1 hypothetical protein [Nitrosopumilaceae archaeon]